MQTTEAPNHTPIPHTDDHLRRAEEAHLFILMERFIERGYAIVAFTPEELGEADPDAVASHMIEHGWQMIDVENAPKTQDRADSPYVHDPTQPTEFKPPICTPEYMQALADEARAEEEAWREKEAELKRGRKEEQWVIVTYWPHEPTEVYGTFRSQREALDYAERQGFHHTCAYDLHQILDIEEE